MISEGRIIGAAALSMTDQSAISNKLLDVFFNRVAIRPDRI